MALDSAARDLALAHRALLGRALVLEEERRAQHPEWPPSWEWFEVKAEPHVLRRLLLAGLLRVEWRSNSGTHYRVEGPEEVRALLEAPPEPPSLESGAPSMPSDLFDVIVGHDALKDICRRALLALKPVHVLMVGPPSTAKSLFLMELARLPGSMYALGTTTSRQGLARFLADRRPRYLLVDELDKAFREDLAVLLSVMEDGKLVEVKAGRVVQEDLPLRVFAAGNSERGLPPELLSRFLRVKLRPYLATELREVMVGVLVKREGVPQTEAAAIADLCLRYGLRDVRDAVRLRRLSRGCSDVERILRYIAGKEH
ncbi:MAG: AAA family ATPase [Halobacteria archaeon]